MNLYFDVITSDVNSDEQIINATLKLRVKPRPGEICIHLDSMFKTYYKPIPCIMYSGCCLQLLSVIIVFRLLVLLLYKSDCRFSQFLFVIRWRCIAFYIGFLVIPFVCETHILVKLFPGIAKQKTLVFGQYFASDELQYYVANYFQDLSDTVFLDVDTLNSSICLTNLRFLFSHFYCTNEENVFLFGRQLDTSVKTCESVLDWWYILIH